MQSDVSVHVARNANDGSASATGPATIMLDGVSSFLDDPYCTAVLAKKRSDVPSDPQSSGILKNKVIRGEVFGR